MEREVLDMKDIANHKPKIQDFGQITISVQEPIFYQKDTFKYFLYHIVGKDKDGPYSIRRRYSDFDFLRKKLCQRWLGIYIPPISGKRAQNNPLYVLKIFDNSNEEKYAETRRKFLKYFCEGIAVKPYLYNSDLFQLFIRGGPDYETAISSCIIKEYSSILHAYELSFERLLLQNQNSKFEEQIDINQKHLAALKQSENSLLGICEKIFKATEAREDFNIQFNLSMKKTIPEYQQKFLLNHVGKNREKLILNRNQEFAAKIQQLQKINAINPLQKFLEMIMYEIRQVKAFIEAIQGRKQAQKRKIELKQKISEKQNQKNKLLSGSFSFKALFKSGSKELQMNELTMKIEILRNELLCIEKMIVIMVMNTNFQIVDYRNRRGKEYSQIFRTVASLELTQLDSYLQLTNIPLSVLQS